MKFRTQLLNFINSLSEEAKRDIIYKPFDGKVCWSLSIIQFEVSNNTKLGNRILEELKEEK